MWLAACEENHSIVEAARRTFQEIGQEKFAYEEINEADAMMELCLEIEPEHPPRGRRSAFLRRFLGCYNEELGTICYANAGHTPGLLRDPSGITELPATGLPLGLFSASTYEAPTAAAAEGSFSAAGFARRSGGSAQAQEGRVRA